MAMIRGLVVLVLAGVFSMTAKPAMAEDQRIVREDIEWPDVWIPHSNDHALPRVLLLGDSITRAYYPEVETKLQGTACVARLATSKSLGDPALLQQVALVLDEAKFDVIHFNNGMHGWGYSEEEYRQAFPQLLETIRNHAPGAKLIWATTTPVRVHGAVEKVDARTERVRARNKDAADIVGKENIPVDDLFSLVENHPEYYSQDGVHFNGQGVSAEAAQVADSIRKALAP